MPKDIRSYFTSAVKKGEGNNSGSKVKKRAVISSDEDESKLQSPVKRSKITKKSNKHQVLSDSDDDVVLLKDNKKSKPLKTEDEKPKKVVTPAQMFGSKPVSREEAPKISKKLQKQEAEFHKDDDFEATLEQLDTSQIEEEYLSEKKHDKQQAERGSPKKKNGHKDSSDKEKHESHTTSLHNRKESKTESEKRKHSSLEEEQDLHSSEKKHHTPKKKTKDSSIEDVHSNEKERKKSKKSRKDTSSNVTVEIEHKKPKKDSPEKPAMDIYEERIEKKKQTAALYQQYLQRGGARNPGSKKIPEGAECCLAGLSFLITGVLDSLEREEAEELIKKYGGRILQQVSKKTDYVIVGDQPGPAKMSKAESLNIKRISEDDLLEMIRTRPAGRSSDIKQPQAKSRGKQKSDSDSLSSPSPVKPKLEVKKETEPVVKTSPVKKQETTTALKKSPEAKPIASVKTETQNERTSFTYTEALVEKYRPKTLKQIVGQQGDKSCAKKLYNWLLNWHKNRNKNVKPVKPNPWAKSEDGAIFKAALLSGPPGIGKTTTVQVACKELGLDLVEFNASDTRSKRLLKEEVSELLSNTSMKGYFSAEKTKPTAKHVLLMDEVDGMAGNEDRGGLQELISLIKSTDVPIVCICNDRNNMKMRTLSNYTFDLRFQKPRLEQIRAAMKSICFKENIQISTEDLDCLIESTNQDIRQVINHLALMVGKSGHQEKSQKKHINKDLKLGPWDVVKQVFSVDEHKNMSIHDKSDLFFHDYNIASLFVQENYLLVMPQAPRSELLERVAASAESLALGDVCEKAIRSNGSWTLLPVQACYSSVIPGTVMEGHIVGQINFPAWLGRNSKATKFNRLMQGITVHTRLTTGASKEAINLDYLNHLRDAIVRPLASGEAGGVEQAVNVMNQYHLMREDLDSLLELSLWPGQRDPMQAVDTKVKSAFTRLYNKNASVVPYVVNATAKKKAAQSSQDEDFIEDEEEVTSEEDEDNIDTDKMIKVKKPTAAKKTESTSKGNEKPKRGRGRGKAK